MADKRSIDFDDVLRKVLTEGSPDLLRSALGMLSSRIMELEATGLAGAEKGERSDQRQDHRNGYRPRTWDTRVGTIDLQVPKLRWTGYVPSFLEPRQRSEKALLSVVQEAYVLGVSTQKVDDLLQAMGLTGISKSAVSRICEELDGIVKEFRTRPLAGRFPYLCEMDPVSLDTR
jgi:transposase-like protein